MLSKNNNVGGKKTDTDTGDKGFASQTLRFVDNDSRLLPLNGIVKVTVTVKKVEIDDAKIQEESKIENDDRRYSHFVCHAHGGY